MFSGMGDVMKKILLLAFGVLVFAPLAFAVDKEIIQLQQNVALMQGLVRELQRSFDEKMAVMQTLQGQTNDKINQVTQLNNQITNQLNSQLNSGLAELQKLVQTAAANSSQKVDSLNSQVQGMQSSLDDLRARLDKLSEQVTKLVTASQTIPSGGSGGVPSGSPEPGGGFPQPAPGGFSQPPAGGFSQPAPGAFNQPASGGFNQPAPDILYNNALRDYTGGNYPLAFQEFGDYLRYYPNSALASNAQFYLGDIYYQQGQFPKAIQEYDKAIEQYPDGNKTAAAQLKKGYSLLNMDLRQQGVRELNSLIKRFPDTPEAALAKDKLANLPPAKPAPKPRPKAAD